MSLPYCSADDVQRKLDLTSSSVSADERERFATRAAVASQRWDSETRSPLRTVRVGAVNSPETWEYHDAHGVRRGPPVEINLSHSEINPIDASTGDTIEVRTGRDNWEEVTTEEGDEFSLVYRNGQLKLYRFLLNQLRFEDQQERLVRLTYRYGGLGGGRDKGATTALSASASATTTSLSVDDAARLPPAPAVVMLGESADAAEYVRVTDIDRATDTLTVSRAVRQTTPLSHNSGAIVQYTPADVREGVAAKAAELLTLDDDARLSIPDEGQLTSRTTRADRFRDEWEKTTARYQSVRIL